MINPVENKDVIDRKAASRLLKVSLRTLDRYRQAGHITTKIIDNKILLSRSEIIEFMASQRGRITRHARHDKYSGMSNDTQVDKTNSRVDSDDNDHNPIFVETQNYTSKSSSTSGNTTPSPEPHARDHDLIETYKKMYEQLITELKARQEELEGAHYRIGQLESQIKYGTITQRNDNAQLPQQTEILRLTQSAQSLQNEISDKTTRLKKVREALYYEKLNKRIYLGIVITLLLLQPLWLLLKN